MFLPGFTRLHNGELLNLLKLMHSEDTPGILAGCAGLLPEAGGESTKSDGEIFPINLLMSEIPRNRLFSSSNQVLLVLLLCSILGGELVEGLIEL